MGKGKKWLVRPLVELLKNLDPNGNRETVSLILKVIKSLENIGGKKSVEGLIEALEIPYIKIM